MNQYKGIVEIDVFGAKKGFKFGTMQAALFCKSMNCKLAEMSELLDGTDIEAQITWYWTAAVAYARLFKKEEPSKDEVAAWIDTFGFETMEKTITENISIPNDQTPPTPEGTHQ